MKTLKTLLLLLLLLASPVSGQSLAEAIANQQLILDAAKASLTVPPTSSDYHAITDTTIKLKPPPPILGAAGFQFTDPTFGSLMWRVTDTATSNGSSLRVPSSAHASAWNSDGTKFYVVNTGGGAIFFSFDGTKPTKLSNQITSQLEPQFSFVDPNLIFGVSGHLTKTWRLDTNLVTTVFDFDTIYPQLPLANTYIGGILVVDGDIWAAHFGGAGMDQHVFVHHSTKGLLDVRKLGWKIHAIELERTGRWVFVYPANDPTTGRLPPGVAQVQLWDTLTNTLTPQTIRPAGHGSVGYGWWINQDCCSAGTWDAGQWQVRHLLSPLVVTDLLPAVLTPQSIYLAEHSNWRNAKPDKKVPIISANYRFGPGLSLIDYPWRARDEEIMAIATDGSGTVWRFAHTQATNPNEFWNQPIVNCAPSGRYCIFTSNWGNPTGRQDVFLLQLK